MNIAWVLAEHSLLPADVPNDLMRQLAPIWGSWRNIRGFGVDNAICYDSAQSHRLLDQGYADLCNLYVSLEVKKDVENPRVKVFGGSLDFDIDSRDDIVSLHLAASTNQIVLLIGFDLAEIKNSTQKRQDYLELVYQTMNQYPGVQWVVVDHPQPLWSKLQGLSNITCDSMTNVLNLLNAG